MDCFDGMEEIEDNSVDLILTDPPYGVTAGAWDKKPDLEKMWGLFNRIIAKNGAILIFATQPFATDVVNANRKYFRYDLIWEKNQPVGFLNSGKMPLRAHEIILVFYKNPPRYFPQKIPGEFYKRKNEANRVSSVYRRELNKKFTRTSSERHPTSILLFSLFLSIDRPGKITQLKHPSHS
jgi:site-specific DNA-methyltransferase (adenine-specific)